MLCDHHVHDRCRSCRWLDREPAAQLADKLALLQGLLAPFAPARVDPPLASPPSGFRNKAKMAVLPAPGGALLGIVNHHGAAVGLSDCPLYPADMQALLQALQDWVRTLGLPPYDVARARGELKFLLLTRAQAGGGFLLRIVLRSEQALPDLRAAVPALQAAQPSIKVVSANIQPVHMAILEGEREILLSEAAELREMINEVPIHLRPRSFLQTNPAVAAALYRTARAWLGSDPPASLWDLYCGSGAFGLHCAGPDTALLGVEREAEAVAGAQASADELGLRHARYLAGDAAGLFAGSAQAPAVVVVNPPRRGLGEGLCRALERLAPARILYSSCNAHSLAQDLARLPGYRIARAQLFDMFPHTPHFETLVLLHR